MFNLETINDTHRQILVLAQEKDKDSFLHRVVETVAKTLDIYFVGIYLADTVGEFLYFKAGSGEFGKRLLKHGHKIKISESGNFNDQAGTAVYLNEIRLAYIETESIMAWKISTNGISETKLRDDIEIFVGSPMFPSSLIELFLPLQTNGKAIGVIEISLDVSPDISSDKILKLQEMANEITLELA